MRNVVAICPRCNEEVEVEVLGFNIVDPITEQEGSIPLLRCMQCGWEWWNI
jgi:uncharacterized Zn finger protein